MAPFLYILPNLLDWEKNVDLNLELKNNHSTFSVK